MGLLQTLNRAFEILVLRTDPEEGNGDELQAQVIACELGQNNRLPASF
jgi:hypothetical protein